MVFACNPGENYKLLGYSDDDYNDDNFNFTSIEALCVDGNYNTLEDFVNWKGECLCGYIIPALGQRTVMFFARVLLILGTLLVRRKV